LVTPTTWLSAILLLLLSLICFASWPNTFKRAGRWRFELFSCDFAAGALLLALVAAYTLGTLGSSLGFGDRLLVSGRTDQALAVLAGGGFALSNMLFLSSLSLIGMAAVFPLTAATACAVIAVTAWRGSSLILMPIGVALVLVTVLLDAVAIRKRGTALAAAAAASAAQAQAQTEVQTGTQPIVSKVPRNPLPGMKGKAVKKWRISSKGILTGIISGVVMGICLPIIYNSTFNEFGLGAYAGLLMFSLGLFGATLVLNVYFMNVAIHGGSLTFSSYFTGSLQQHLLGFAGGAIWAAGALALGLALSVPAPNGLSTAVGFIVPSLASLLAMFWGLAIWKEYATAPGQAKQMLLLAGGSFLLGVLLLGFGAAQLKP
jgi:glucose uptake protein